MPRSRPLDAAAPGGGIAEPEAPPSPLLVAASYAVVLLLTVLLTLWGAFLVPFRIGGVLVPVSWAVVGAGNVALVLAGGRLLGNVGAAVPGLLWLGLVAILGSRRTEGDVVLPLTVVLPSTVVGLGYLLVGVLASGLAYGRAASIASSAGASSSATGSR